MPDTRNRPVSRWLVTKDVSPMAAIVLLTLVLTVTDGVNWARIGFVAALFVVWIIAAYRARETK